MFTKILMFLMTVAAVWFGLIIVLSLPILFHGGKQYVPSRS